MSELKRFQYVQGEDGRVFPNVVVEVNDDGEPTAVAGFTLDVGQTIEAVSNPDPSRFAELVPAAPEPVKPAKKTPVKPEPLVKPVSLDTEPVEPKA